jgi:hypothetical protein
MGKIETNSNQQINWEPLLTPIEAGAFLRIHHKTAIRMARSKPRTVLNFPMQANGSETLRWACIFATERGIDVHAPVQDALLVGGSVEDIEGVVAATQDAMARASDLVLDGFILRSEAKIVSYPDHYIDERGVEMWNRIMGLLDALEMVA